MTSPFHTMCGRMVSTAPGILTKLSNSQGFFTWDLAHNCDTFKTQFLHPITSGISASDSASASAGVVRFKHHFVNVKDRARFFALIFVYSSGSTFNVIFLIGQLFLQCMIY